jgi:hypothetical protein
MKPKTIDRQRIIGPLIISSFSNGKQLTKDEITQTCSAKIKEVRILIIGTIWNNFFLIISG